MPNPRAQQQLLQASSSPLDRAVQSFKSIKEPAQALGDMLASTLRGSTAATLGAGGDIRELVDLLGPEKVEALLGKRVMPTTEEMKGMLPKATSYEHPYESIGEFLPLPGTGTALKAAGYGLGRGAGALTRTAGQAVSDALIHQAGPLAQGPLSALAPRMAMTNVVKPKGGNWETGAVEKNLKPMTRGLRKHELDALLNQNPNMTPERRQMFIDAQANLPPEDEALNKWIQSNLTNYVKKEMGTPEDPIRRLAEEGITHFPPEDLRREADWLPERLEVTRKKAGFPAEGLGKSPEAQGWEIKADTAIEPTDVGTMRHLSHLFKKDITEPWMAKVPDETKVYMANDDLHASYLGFDHILDVLRQDVAAGRIRPDQLSKVSMEQAVRRTHEFDQEQARKMAEAQIKQQEGFPVHKEYPEGYKWIELTKPNAPLPEGYTEGVNDKFVFDPSGKDVQHPNIKALEDALKYEGDTMGHCVGGYCPDVLEGRSRIYSLRDKKGEPHVTVEVAKGQPRTSYEEMSSIYRQADQEANARDFKTPYERDNFYNDKVKELQYALLDQKAADMPERIVQIKGKQNRAPKEDYVPYVQDFVKGGKWSEVGDLHNANLYSIDKDFLGGLADFTPQAEDIKHLKKPQRMEALAKAMDAGDLQPGYATRQDWEEAIRKHGSPTYGEVTDDLLRQLQEPIPPVEGMSAGGTPRPPTEQERETLRKLRESFVPAATEAERLKKVQDNLDKMNRKVSLSNNPDQMWMEVQDQKLAGGGLTKLAKLARAPAKTKAEIEAIAERMAPQVMGEYVRASEKSAKTVAGKTQKQFEREKELKHDIRPTSAERPLPKEVNIEDLKNQVMMGISGDPTITGQTLHTVGGRELRNPSPQHGGPLYGLGHDKEHFWASNLGAAQGVQNRAREIAQQYDAPVLGNYVMMGPDSYSYAQHFADANLQNIRPEEMTKAQIEGFNKLMRQGSLKSGVRPSWPGIENPEEAYLHMAVDPELRKHFGNLMQMPTVTQQFGLPSGLDVAHAVTEPSLRDLEIGVTGKSMGLMRPDVKELKLSEHPTYSHDIPGEFMGGMRFPVPYELSFPDSLKAVRENPKQAPQEFGSLKMVGPRQVIDQQLIDEIRAYEERMKQLTGRAAGGEVSADDVILEERPL